MITLTTTLRETLKTQDVLQDLRINRIFDIEQKQINSNLWQFFTLDVDAEDIADEIQNMLLLSGLTEFEISIND